MPSPLYNQLQQRTAGDGFMNQFLQFKRAFSGDPRQMLQQMLNTGRISQSQLNQYAQQADQIYRQLKGLK